MQPLWPNSPHEIVAQSKTDQAIVGGVSPFAGKILAFAKRFETWRPCQGSRPSAGRPPRPRHRRQTIAGLKCRLVRRPPPDGMLAVGEQLGSVALGIAGNLIQDRIVQFQALNLGATSREQTLIQVDTRYRAVGGRCWRAGSSGMAGGNLNCVATGGQARWG